MSILPVLIVTQVVPRFYPNTQVIRISRRVPFLRKIVTSPAADQATHTSMLVCDFKQLILRADDVMLLLGRVYNHLDALLALQPARWVGRSTQLLDANPRKRIAQDLLF